MCTESPLFVHKYLRQDHEDKPENDPPLGQFVKISSICHQYVFLTPGWGQCCRQVWQMPQDHQELQRADGAQMPVVSHQGL